MSTEQTSQTTQQQDPNKIQLDDPNVFKFATAVVNDLKMLNNKLKKLELVVLVTAISTLLASILALVALLRA